MGKVVAFVSVCMAWFTFCLQASPAFGMKVVPPAGWEFSSFSADPYAPVLSRETNCLPGIRDLLLPADGKTSSWENEDGLGLPFLFRVGHSLFAGSSREGDRLIYSIDPSTMCVSVFCVRRCASVREEWTVTDGSFPGSRPERARGSSSGPQSGFMAIAGLTMIGLSTLRRNRVVRAVGSVHEAQGRSQAWKGYPAKKEPAYQTRAA